MLAIARVLVTRPKLVLLDEPSMGLAPQMVEEVFESVRGLNRRSGVSFLVAEQNAAVALAYAHHGYIVENGRVPRGERRPSSWRRTTFTRFIWAGVRTTASALPWRDRGARSSR